MFNAITEGKSFISMALALQIERELGLEEGTLVILQADYDIQKIKEKEIPEIPIITNQNYLGVNDTIQKISIYKIIQYGDSSVYTYLTGKEKTHILELRNHVEYNTAPFKFAT